MTRPQRSEMRRSGTAPTYEQDSIGSRLDPHPRSSSMGESGPVPEENLPGHHPEHEQDQPDLDAFAARFSGRDLDDLSTARRRLEESATATDDDEIARRPAFMRWVPVIAGVVALAAVLVFWRRRRRA